MTKQELDFSGGPWKTRCGEVVNNLKKEKGFSSFIWDCPDTDNTYWDMDGNAFTRPTDINGKFLNGIKNDQWDLMENLNNWKYNRGNYVE